MKTPAALIALAAFSSAPMAAPLPADVQRLVDRKFLCEHFAGEEAYDEARAIQIAQAMREARCNSVPSDEAKLRVKYKRQPAALSALEAVRP